MFPILGIQEASFLVINVHVSLSILTCQLCTVLFSWLNWTSKSLTQANTGKDLNNWEEKLQNCLRFEIEGKRGACLTALLSKMFLMPTTFCIELMNQIARKSCHLSADASLLLSLQILNTSTPKNMMLALNWKRATGFEKSIVYLCFIKLRFFIILIIYIILNDEVLF